MSRANARLERSCLPGQGVPRNLTTLSPDGWPGKCLNRKVVIKASPRALRPPFWSSGLPLTSRDLLGGVKLRPRRSLEVRGSPELQNGGLRALGKASMTTIPGHPWMQGFPITRPAFGSISVRPAMVLCSPFRSQIVRFCVLVDFVSRWLQEVSSCVQGGFRRSGEVQSSRTVA